MSISIHITCVITKGRDTKVQFLYVNLSTNLISHEVYSKTNLSIYCKQNATITEQLTRMM